MAAAPPSRVKAVNTIETSAEGGAAGTGGPGRRGRRQLCRARNAAGAPPARGARARTPAGARLTDEVPRHDDDAQPDAPLDQEDAAPLVAQGQLHQVLLHEPGDRDARVLRRAPAVLGGGRGEGPRHGRDLQPAQRQPRGREGQGVGVGPARVPPAPPAVPARAPPSPGLAAEGGQARQVLPLVQVSDPEERVGHDALQHVALFVRLLLGRLQSEGSAPDGELPRTQRRMTHVKTGT